MNKLEKVRWALENAKKKLKIECGGEREYKGGVPTQFLFPQIDEALKDLDELIKELGNKSLGNKSLGNEVYCDRCRSVWVASPDEVILKSADCNICGYGYVIEKKKGK